VDENAMRMRETKKKYKKIEESKKGIEMIVTIVVSFFFQFFIVHNLMRTLCIRVAFYSDAMQKYAA
jgi:hypothetical protein